MGRLVVVSNRVATTEGATSGGLAVALRSGLRGEPALWFGWSGERALRHTGELTERRLGDLDVVTFDLSEADASAVSLAILGVSIKIRDEVSSRWRPRVIEGGQR